MPRDPKDIFDTSAKIRAALENTGEGNGDSSDLNTSEDTDSLDESYLPSADEVIDYVSEMQEDKATYASYLALTQSSTAADTDKDEGEGGSESEGEGASASASASVGQSAAEVFGRGRSVSSAIPSTPQPLLTSTPMAVGTPDDAGTEADSEDVPDRGRCVERRVARRRLYSSPARRGRGAAGGGDAGGDSDSDPDDPPARIYFPPRRPVASGVDAPGPSGVPLQASRSRSPVMASRPSRPVARQTRARSGRRQRATTVPRSRTSSGHSASSGRSSSSGRRVSRPRIVRPGGRGAAPQDAQADPMPGPVYVDQGWTWDDAAGFLPRQYNFAPASQPGPTFTLPPDVDFKRAYIFKEFMTETIMALIVQRTNLYNWYRKAGKVERPRSLFKNYEEVTVDEMYTFLAIIFLMGAIKKNSIHRYWSTDPLICTPGFNKVMSRNRFQAILSNLHFINSLDSHYNNQDKQPKDKDPMERIRPISDYIKNKFQDRFNPYQKLVIDESLCLWRGNISFRQYIPSKRHRYGLKTFVLCDCKTGYIQDVLLYMGSRTELEDAPPDVGISGAVVCTMLKPYLNEGRILYTDNWYTSPALSIKLDSEGTGSCGTVRRNRKHLPPLPATREPDSKIYKQANGILLLSWVDNKEVNLISTVHEPIDEPVRRRRRRWTRTSPTKPQLINDYNVNMRLVDKKDQVIASAECARKTMRWYKKFFFHLLDVVMYNSNIVMTELTGKKEAREEFCVELARELIIEHKQAPISRTPMPAVPDPTQGRLTDRHFPDLVPATATNTRACRRCFMCSHTTRRPKKRTESRYMCVECDVALCVVPCFREYHTLAII